MWFSVREEHKENSEDVGGTQSTDVSFLSQSCPLSLFFFLFTITFLLSNFCISHRPGEILEVDKCDD